MGKKDYLDDYLDGYFDHIDSFEAFHSKRSKGVPDDDAPVRKEARKVKDTARARRRKELEKESTRD